MEGKPAGILALLRISAAVLLVAVAVTASLTILRSSAAPVTDGLLASGVTPAAVEEPADHGAPEPAVAGAAGPAPTANAASTPIGYTRVPRPQLAPGPRRVGIQAGHWQTQLAPPELGRILAQTGTSWAGITEVEINLDIAGRIAAILRGKGLVVDVLPTTIPPAYVADAFVSLHGDGDGAGAKSGFKIAHSTRRTPYEDALLAAIKQEYAEATALEFDAAGISRAMSFYYAFSWSRVRYSAAPHTPSVILEMGFVSNDHDRWLMTERAEVLASAIATGIVRFLDAHPREKLFGEDLLVPAPIFRFATPTPAR